MAPRGRSFSILRSRRRRMPSASTTGLGRAERARVQLPALIREAASRVVELSVLVDRVRAGEASADEILEVLPESGAGGRGTAGAPGPTLPYRRYWTSGGLEVRGRTRIQSQRSTDVQALCAERHLPSCETFGGCTRRTPVERGRDATGSGSGAGSEPRRPALQGTNLRERAGGLDEEEVRA